MNPLLQLPSHEQRIADLIDDLVRVYHVKPSDVRVVISPYRICPLGAHVDHQHGRVTGMALDQAVLLAFAPAPAKQSRQVLARSLNFEGEVAFDINDIPPRESRDWGNYVRGAAAALRQKFDKRFRRGMVAVVDGRLPVGGISSSAAVGVAYLLALEAVNDLSVSIADNIQLDRAIENAYIGLNNGILDQSVILASQSDRLLALDCQNEEWQTIPGASSNAFRVLVVHSGVTETLVATGYNQRVAECREAARLLLAAARKPITQDAVLRDVPEAAFRHHGVLLPSPLRQRAMHFYTEQQRVLAGMQAWEESDLARFGELITQSGRSSVVNYECGCPQLITLYEFLASTKGVYGTRFSGAGFRGSCIALVEPSRAEAIAADIVASYARRHPVEAARMAVALCNSDDGARLAELR